MKYTAHNIELNTIIFDVMNKRLGVVDVIYSEAPYLSIGVLFIGSDMIETIDQYRLTNGFEFRIIPTISLAD